MQVFDRQTGKSLMVNGISYDTDMEFLIVRLCPKHKVKLAKGTNYTLSMSFTGNLTDQLRGLYRSTYKEDGVEKYARIYNLVHFNLLIPVLENKE